MGKVSEKRRDTEESAPRAEQIAALEAKRDVLLEELRRVEARIREARENKPVAQSGCQTHAEAREEKSPKQDAPSKPAVDRSKWPPKLRKLVEERFPEEGREERIRRAREHPVPTFKIGNLTPEQIKYFAEDVELEYDV
jgi:hypothetical protein